VSDGTLPEDAFCFYVRHDYLFLINYGRLLALAAARAPRLEWMRRFSGLAQSVLETEMDLPRQFAARWGVTTEQLEPERTAQATDAYCDFLLLAFWDSAWNS
jgi:thiaminase/transcriptional activator TenA